MPSGAVLEGRGRPLRANSRALACLVSRDSELAYLSSSSSPPFRPRALACLVSRDSELAYLLRSLIKLSPPPPYLQRTPRRDKVRPLRANPRALAHHARVAK